MVKVVQVDPYDKVTGLLVPFLTQRMLDMARETALHEIAKPETLVAEVMRPLWARDPGVLLLAFVNEKFQVVGHLAALIQGDREHPYVFVFQCKFDDNVGEARWDALRLLDEWGRKFGCEKMRMATPGKNEKAWARKYGFKVDGLIYTRPLGYIPEGDEEG